MSAYRLTEEAGRLRIPSRIHARGDK